MSILRRPRWPALFLFLFACGAGDDGGSAGPDAAVNPNCPDPTVVLPTSYRPINAVSKSPVETLSAATIHVDATAGGFNNFGDNPFVYLSFAGGAPAKVEITDTEAYRSRDWDLALKRTVIRASGGDSGPGGVEVAAASAASLAGASEPDDGSFGVDDFATDDCELNAGQIGEPLTIFDGWYAYDTATNLVSPRENVYFVRGGPTAFKLRIVDYYRGGDSAHFEIEWSALD